MSLVGQAESGRLPAFQYMDQATCDWIAAHNPELVTGGMLALPTRSEWLKQISLANTWFLEPKLQDTLHGTRHLLRTAYYGAHLAEAMDLHDQAARNLVIACLVHDIRRQDDKGDPSHGSRGGEWFRVHAGLVAGNFKLTPLSQSSEESIAIAIALHETPYDSFNAKQQQQYGAHKQIVDGLKTADALDRYRLPRLKWWIDNSYLRLSPAPLLQQYAYNLVLASERQFLAGLDSTAAVHKGDIHEG